MENNPRKRLWFKEIIPVYYEPIGWVEDLAQSRKSDFLSKQEDKSRNERLLDPILEAKKMRFTQCKCKHLCCCENELWRKQIMQTKT